MNIEFYDSKSDFSALRAAISREDRVFFKMKAPGENAGDWRFNRDTNPLDYLSVGKNQRFVVLRDGDAFCGYARVSLHEQSKSCFDVRLTSELDYVYILPSKRGSGASKFLIDGLVQATDQHLSSISKIFPMKRTVSVTLSSMPVSPGGLSFTKQYMEKVKAAIRAVRYPYLEIRGIDFDLDMSSARFSNRSKTEAVSYDYR